jgi:hypothetical protein
MRYQDVPAFCRGVREREAVGHRFGLVEQIAAD